MTSVTFADPWLEGSVAMEKETVTQMEELNRSLAGQSSSSWSSMIDDSLTSLHWLQEFSMSSTSRGPHTTSHQPGASTSPSAGDLASIGLSQTGSKHTPASYSRPPPPKRVSRGQCLKMDFSTRNIRPPFTYAHLIHLAMQASNLPKITLACINKWIQDNFCYYRHADPTWQNSIRQTLSRKKCFVRVPRQNNEPGKGGFWAFDPQHDKRLSAKNKNLNQNNKQDVKSEPTTSSPILPVPPSPVVDVKEDLSAIFDWDALVDSAIDEYFGKNEGLPLSPVESQEAQVSSELDLDLFLEAELTATFPETFWNVFEGTDLNILGCSTENIEPV